jgi:hypothetical protein
MGIGVGTVLALVGLVLVLRVLPDVPGIDEVTLGWILLVGGVVAGVLALVVNQHRSRSKQVGERRTEG